MVKISIIVPIYNAEIFLHESISSLLNQTFKDIELICVNDGSTDNSLNILKEFALKDNRIRIINQKNAGCGFARNKGLNESNGDYCYFFDPDDFLVEDALEKLYLNAIRNDSDIVLFKLAFKSDNKPVDYNNPHFNLDEYFDNVDFDNFAFNYKEIKQYIMNAKAFAPWFKLYKREFLNHYDDLYFPINLPFDDVPFHIKTLLRAKKISFVPDFFYHYRIDNLNSINNNPKNCMEILNIIDIVEEFLKKEGFFNEFIYEFFNFKIFHTQIYFFRTLNKEEFFQSVKIEYVKINNYFIENNLDFKNIYDDLINIFHMVIESNSFEEYELKFKIKSLKNTNKKLKKENIKLNKKNNTLKNNIDEILNSKSWKVISVFRKFRNIFR